jgi:hypothetical protein
MVPITSPAGQQAVVAQEYIPITTAISVEPVKELYCIVGIILLSYFDRQRAQIKRRKLSNEPESAAASL